MKKHFRNSTSVNKPGIKQFEHFANSILHQNYVFKKKAEGCIAIIQKIIYKIVETPGPGIPDAKVSPKYKESLSRFDLSNLEIGEVLGTGGFCEVREMIAINYIVAKNENIDGSIEISREALQNNSKHDQLVIKQIKPDLPEADRPFCVADLLREAHHLQTLSHQHIICMRGMGHASEEEDIQFFLILDRIYCTLDEQVDKWEQQSRPINSPMSAIYYSKSAKNAIKFLFADRLYATRSICSALKYIHGKKIIFRDLKPQNIGFDARGEIKIFDFGLAKELDPNVKIGDNYKMTGMTGTMRYMAPEVFKQEPYNLSADVYSFGVVSWYIFALRVPFAHYSASMYRRNVVDGFFRPKVNSTWGAKVCNLITSCWNPDPSSRPTFVEICYILTEHKACEKSPYSRSKRSMYL